jgi:hypothetical protein
LSPTRFEPLGRKNVQKLIDIEPEPVLMKKTVLGGELDVAPTDIGAAANRPVKSFRQGCRQLEVGRRAVIEINPLRPLLPFRAAVPRLYV